MIQTDLRLPQGRHLHPIHHPKVLPAIPSLHRCHRNPLLTPERVERVVELPPPTLPVSGNRITGVFNPAAAVVEDSRGAKQVALLFRIYDAGTGTSFIGLAASRDGVDFGTIYKKPVIAPTLPEESKGVEDPRVTYLPDEKLYAITYTGYSEKGPCVCLITTPNLLDPSTYVKHGKILEPDNKDAVLFPEKINGRYAILERPFPNIALASAEKLEGPWSSGKVVLRPEAGTYRSGRVGAGAPPVKTPLGWLLPIHGAQQYHEGNTYAMGWLLLDSRDPSRIRYISEKPALSPEARYEIHRKGEGPIPQIGWENFPNGVRVVFPEGMVEWGDRYLVYYGAADRFVGMAWVSKKALLDSIGKIWGKVNSQRKGGIP